MLNLRGHGKVGVIHRPTDVTLLTRVGKKPWMSTSQTNSETDDAEE